MFRGWSDSLRIPGQEDGSQTQDVSLQTTTPLLEWITDLVTKTFFDTRMWPVMLQSPAWLASSSSASYAYMVTCPALWSPTTAAAGSRGAWSQRWALFLSRSQRANAWSKQPYGWSNRMPHSDCDHEWAGPVAALLDLHLSKAAASSSVPLSHPGAPPSQPPTSWRGSSAAATTASAWLRAPTISLSDSQTWEKGDLSQEAYFTLKSWPSLC